MKKLTSKNTSAIAVGIVAAMVMKAGAQTATTSTTSAGTSVSSQDPVVQALIEKGILSQKEAERIQAEIAARQTNIYNNLPASKWKISDSIQSIQLFGDVRLRYEYRAADNVPGVVPDTYYKERFRYAVRVGLRGDLTDDFNYGVRVETSTNPRSPWATFGNNTTAGSVTPSDKAQSGINISQAFIGWHPENWYEMTVGRMPMPLYTTPMVWDSDINPEGAFEKFKYTVGNVDLFADFGQFDYQSPSTASISPTGDTFLLAWQLGANAHLTKNTSFKVAPMLYTYAGHGTSGGLNMPFVGQGLNGSNVGVPGGANVAGYNEQGINDLTILEVPAEFNFELPKTPLGALHGRVFGDFGYNFRGDTRANAAYAANPAAFPGLTGPVHGEAKAYQAGIGIGSAGTTYGPTQGFVYVSTCKKHDWEARAYWQHVEQYALDVNLLDSDFLEGRGNLEGVYTAFSYCFTDAIMGTIRYGHGDRINDQLGTGGNNPDLPAINPIKNYNIVQMDLTWKF
jgi:hypothetical protein